ncbi:MAG: hypothetical protein D6814_02080 [Calditrichaeota bacterium]|nr:MAG: hypothetical protein D6814_02080 [Calditrichota bacterium]
MGIKITLPDKIETLFQEIARDNLSGAAQLFYKSLDLFPALADAIGKSSRQNRKLLFEVSNRLLKLQPTMAPFVHLSRYVSRMAEANFRPEVLETAFRAFPHAARRTLQKQRRKIMQIALQNCASFQRILTHSKSSMVEMFLNQWLADSPAREIWMTEGRPVCEGRLFLQLLEKFKNRKVLLVDDARAMAVQSVDAIVIGADRVSEKYITNKIGTYSLALLAREFDKPVFVLAEKIKFLPESFPLESEPQHAPDEVAQGLENIQVYNYYFEHVPCELMDHFVTPEGSLSPADLVPFFEQGEWDIFKLEDAEENLA